MLTHRSAAPQAIHVARDICLVFLVPKIHYRSMDVSMVELLRTIEQYQTSQLQHPQQTHVSILLHNKQKERKKKELHMLIISIVAYSSSQTVSSSATDTASSNNSGPSHSKIWIVGAVIGPVVGLAILAGLLFWIWHLKKRLSANKVIQPPTGSEYALGPFADGPKNPSTSVMSGSGLSPPELESAHSPHSAAEVPSNWVHQTSEFPTTRPVIAEVPARYPKVELAG